MGWLWARALIARTPGQTSDAAIFVTRTGRRIATDGPLAFFAGERLQGGIHPLLEREARPLFLIGKYELGVFASMKAVEIRVRHLGGFPDDAVGVELMIRAFRPAGTLTDRSAAKGEQDGMRNLFAGAYAVLRNPALMRILDRIGQRMRRVRFVGSQWARWPG